MKKGRPKLPDDERRDATLLVRLTRADMKAIEAAAKAAGVNVSEWARRVLLCKQELAERGVNCTWLCGQEIRLEVRGLTKGLWTKLTKVVALLEPRP
jgi:hypothetical protein